MSDLPRRRLLAAAGSATAAAIAGCSSSDDEPTDEPAENATTPDEESETDLEGTILGEITVENLHDESHTIDVIVEFDDEIEHWSTHALEVGEGATLDRDWPTEPGSFRVTTRLDEGDPQQFTAATLNDPDCLNLFAVVRGGTLEIWSDTDGGPCGAGDAEPAEQERND